MSILRSQILGPSLLVLFLAAGCAKDDITPPPPGTSPLLAVSPTIVEFSATQGAGAASPGSRSIVIANAGGGTFDYAVAGLGATWINLSRMAGTAVDTMVISVDPSALAVGPYQETFDIVADSANGSPVTITVNLLVEAGPRDTVSLSTDTVFAGGIAEILISLTNPDSSIASLNLRLRPASTGILYDTVSTTGRFPASGMQLKAQRTDSVNVVGIVLVDFTNTAPIPTGSGPIMRVRYAVDGAQPPGTYTIDTSSVGLILGGVPLGIAYPAGSSSPKVGFVPGTIVVR